MNQPGSFFLFGSELYSILLNLLSMVPGVIAAMLMPTILKKLDKFKVLFWCNIVNILSGLLIYFLGVCCVDENGNLSDIVERTKIAKYDGGIHFTEDDGNSWEDLTADTIVSMNMFGFTPDILDEIAAQFPAFMENQMPANPVKAEFLLPRSVDVLLKSGKATVKVLTSEDKWYGVTYAADKPHVVAALKAMTEQGKYPDGLWK